jgi:tetratricopeptide (TPR) repeat protein
MKVLAEFCDLMGLKPPRPLRWHANLIVRPEMDLTVMSMMRRAGCDHVTFGIESGSQRVLDLMRKRYRIGDADRVLRAAHEAGIKVSCNFMFGFPGETLEDFALTLEFLRRNARNIDTAYPSRSYCTLEPHSYLACHPEEFRVIPSSAHGQYWRSRDGSNTFVERMRRCEEFSRLAQELGVHVGSGLQTSVEQDRLLSLGSYYEALEDRARALEFFEKYLELDAQNPVVQRKVKALR